MAGVRLIARILGWIGWLTLIVGGVGILALAGSLAAAFGPRGGGLAGLATVVGSAIPLLALALKLTHVFELLSQSSGRA